MKQAIIEDVRWVVVHDSIIVQVTCDDGSVGIGEGFSITSPEAVGVVIDSEKPLLVGRNADLIQEFGFRAISRYGMRCATTLAAVSAIDQALWDARARRLDVPLWYLLGGPVRERVRAIAFVWSDTPGDLASDLQRVAAQGFTAIKFIPYYDEFESLSSSARLAAVVDLVDVARKTLGDEFDLALELHHSFNYADAHDLHTRLRPFDLMFIEDPVPPFGQSRQAELYRRAGINIAAAERHYSAKEMWDFATMEGVAYIRADAGLAGGITEMAKIAHLCDAVSKEVLPHNYGGPVLTAAHMHLGLSMPTVRAIEIDQGRDRQWEGLVDGPPHLEDGWFARGDASGLGVAVDMDRLAGVSKISTARDVPRTWDGGLQYR